MRARRRRDGLRDDGSGTAVPNSSLALRPSACATDTSMYGKETGIRPNDDGDVVENQRMQNIGGLAIVNFDQIKTNTD